MINSSLPRPNTRIALLSLIVLVAASCTSSQGTAKDPVAHHRPSHGVIIGEQSEIHYRTLSKLVANTDDVVELDITSAFRGDKEEGGFTSRYVVARVSQVLRGTDLKSGDMIAVEDEGGWTESGQALQWGEAAKWLKTGDQVVAFLRRMDRAPSGQPKAVTGTFRLTSSQGRLVIDSSGHLSPAVEEDPLSQGWATKYTAAAFEKIVANYDSAESPDTTIPPLSPTAPPVLLTTLTIDGNQWKLIGAPAVGGICFGYGANPTVADLCIRFDDVNPTDQVFQGTDIDGHAVFGLVSPGVTSVGVKTYETEFLASPQAIPFDTTGWQFFAHSLSAGDDVVGAQAQP